MPDATATQQQGIETVVTADGACDVPAEQEGPSVCIEKGELQQQLQQGVEEPWWPAYLASTLTGWTLNAVNSCFCDKCSRGFSSSLSVLQHFRDSFKHMATVEALEANGVLYVYECSQMMQYSYAVGYYDDGTAMYSQSLYDQTAAPSFQQYGAEHYSAASPLQQPIEPPSSDIFTASSEMSEEHVQEEEPAFQKQRPQQQQPRQQREGSHRKAAGSAAAAAAAAPAASGRSARRVQGRGERSAAPQQRPAARQAQAPATKEAYEAVFPALGGDSAASALAVPGRRWMPAAATRKLRSEAPEWAPGCPAACFSTLSLQAAARAAKEAALAEEAAAATALRASADGSEVAPSSTSGSDAVASVSCQVSIQLPVAEAASEAEKPVPTAAAAPEPAPAVASPAKPQPAATGMSWRAVLASPAH